MSLQNYVTEDQFRLYDIPVFEGQPMAHFLQWTNSQQIPLVNSPIII